MATHKPHPIGNAATQSFDEAIAEYKARCREFIGQERPEGVPPGNGTPFHRNGPPYESVVRFDAKLIKRYAGSIGDNNPLYNDPEYGKGTRFGAMVAPTQALILARSPGGQGPARPGGYPVGDFFSGLAWEFYNPLYLGTSNITTNKVTTEFIEKKGSQGDLLFLIEELNYWDGNKNLLGKCYGTLILVPIKSMGGGRAMAVDKVGEQLMYDRKTSQYTPQDFERIDGNISGFTHRGAEPRYWEDVEIGDKIGSDMLPPYRLDDQVTGRTFSSMFRGSADSSGDEIAFEHVYHYLHNTKAGYGTSFPNPVTRWPWGPNAEHEDALLAAYRGQSLPFDGGQHRAQIPHKLIAAWMGDNGWIRRYQVALRRPVYYSDACVYSGEVVKKFTEVQEGDKKEGGHPGKATYHAVGLKIEGTNQVGQTMLQGSVTVYLPSRKDGPVVLPVPHSGKPPYVPYEKFYRDWYQ